MELKNEKESQIFKCPFISSFFNPGTNRQSTSEGNI